MATATEIYRDTKERLTDNGDHDRFQHYFHKKDISLNILEGTPMVALCGKVLEQQVDPKGRSICQACQDFMNTVVASNLPEGEKD
jgi:hypothetical protein